MAARSAAMQRLKPARWQGQALGWSKQRWRWRHMPSQGKGAAQGCGQPWLEIALRACIVAADAKGGLSPSKGSTLHGACMRG